MTESCGVDSLHVNVGDGDCTVHLLVKYMLGAGTLDGLKTIQKAILVDAGPRSAIRSGRQIVSDAFSTIATQYNGGVALTFDAIVLSSWDLDLYGGLFEVLNSEIDAAGVKPGERRQSFQFSWLKYDDKGNPLSTIYAPCAPPSHVPEMQFASANAVDTLTYSYLRPEATQPAYVSGFCRFVHVRKDLLGRDLFVDSPPPVNFVDNPVDSPRSLLARNPPGDKMPGLYCVLANGVSIGTQGSVRTSGSSIALIIMWNNKESSISFYGSGTLDSETQNDILDWISNAPKDTQSKGASVTSMKLGGYGMDPVDNIYAVDTLQPKNIIISNGSKYDCPRWELILLLHTFLMAQEASLAKSKPVYATQYPFYFIKEADQQGIVKYVDFGKTAQVSYDSFLRPNESNAHHRSVLARLFERLNTRLRRSTKTEFELMDVYDDYCIWDEDVNTSRSVQDAQNWVTEQCELRWAQISPITACSHEAAGAALYGPSRKPVTTADTVEYICVESRDASQNAQDGKVHVHYVGSHVKHYQPPVASIQAQTPAYDANSSKPAQRSLCSQFPISTSLTGLNLSTDSSTLYTSVITNSGLYALESQLEPPPDDLEIFRDKNPRLHMSQKALPAPDAASKPRLTALRISKQNILLGTSSSLDQCIVPDGLSLQGHPGTPLKLKAGEASSFVGALRNSMLCLSDKPGSGRNCDLDKDDELLSWFTQSLGATSFQICGTQQQPLSSLTLQVGGRKFSTTFVAHALGLETKATSEGEGISSDIFSDQMGGLISSQNMLVFGLDSSCVADKITLPEALKSVGLDEIAETALIEHFSDVTLTLSNNKGDRNAIWFDPESGYRTVQRLFYHGDSPGSINEWLRSKLTMIDVTAIDLVLKKRNSWMVAGNKPDDSKPDLVKPDVLQEPLCDIILHCSLDLSTAVAGKLPRIEMAGLLQITEKTVSLVLTINQADTWQTIRTWIITQIPGFDADNLLSKNAGLQKILARTTVPQVRRINLTFSLDDSGMPQSITAVSVDVELLVAAGSPNSNNGVLFLFSYNWVADKTWSFRGSLWLKPPAGQAVSKQQLLPDWEQALQLSPLDPDSQGDCLDLKALGTLGALKNTPPGMPSMITSASIEIGSNMVAFGGVIAADPPQGDKPQAYLGRLGVRASLKWDATGQFQFGARLDVDVGLLRCNLSKSKPARLRGVIVYDNGTWVVGSVIKDFDFSNLYTLFAKDTRVALTVLLRFIRVSYLVLVYKYQNDVSGFQMAGSITLGTLEADVVYTVGTPPAGDVFTQVNPYSTNPVKPDANLFSSRDISWDIAISTPGMKDRPEPSLGGLIQSLMGYTILPIPGFVGRVSVGDFKVRVRKASGLASTPDAVYLVATAQVSDLQYVFCMTRPTGSDPNIHTKMVIKAQFPPLPTLDVKPLGKLRQPVDEIFFMWVKDLPPRAHRNDVTKQRGLLQGEVLQLNGVLDILKQKTLNWKTDKKLENTDIAIVAGFHFVIVGIDIMNTKRIIKDYVFATPRTRKTIDPDPQKPDPKPDGKPDEKTSSQPHEKPAVERTQAGEGERAPIARREYDTDSVASMSTASSFSPDSNSKPTKATKNFEGDMAKSKEKGTTHTETQTEPPVVGQKPQTELVKPKEKDKDKDKDKEKTSSKKSGKQRIFDKQVAPYKKKQDLFTFTNVGFQYKDNTIYIYLDAKCVIGPIAAAVIGLCLSITFGRDATLTKLTVDNVGISFKGVVLAFDMPPLVLAGAFYRSSKLTRTLRPGKPNVYVDIKEGGLADFKINTRKSDSGATAEQKAQLEKFKQKDEHDKKQRESNQDILKMANPGDRYEEETASTYAGGVIFAVRRFAIQAAGLMENRRTVTYKIVGPPEVAAGEADKLITPADPSASSGNTMEFVSEAEDSSFFIFAKVEGPLMTFQFATLTGLTGAYGHNLRLRWPEVDEVTEFPFVGMHRARTNPADQLKDLITPGPTGWIIPERGCSWLAAGLKLDICLVLAVDTVAIVQWSPDVRIALVGVAVAELPSVEIPIKFCRVEIGFKASLVFAEGSFKFEGCLSPDSYILHPSCHLRGGLSICFWWQPNDSSQPNFAGDWVVTLGGYHKSFKAPAHYPQPDRLSIEWKCDDWVRIRGEAYFAITPKALMAGGALAVTLRMGNLSAWFNAWIDMLLNYHPFSFSADGGVVVGISFTLDLLFVSTNITGQIGATLHIEGPPVHGTVQVDFWVFGFNVNFGDWSENKKSDVSLIDFCNLAIRIAAAARPTAGAKAAAPAIAEAASGDDSTSDVNSKNQDQCHSFTARSGQIPPQLTDAPKGDAPWDVRSGPFVFAVTSLMPISALKVDGNEKPVMNAAPIYAKAMKKEDALSSELSIRVFSKQARSAAGVLDPAYDKLSWLVDTSNQALPNAIWGQYKSEEDPDLQGNKIDSLLDPGNPSTKLTTEVVLTPPKPTISDEKLLPVSAKELPKEEAFSSRDIPSFPAMEKAQSQFAPTGLDPSPQHFDLVKESWEKARPQSQGMVDFWSSSMFWKPLPEKKQVLNAAPPTMYLKKYDTLWMCAPSLAVGG